MISLGGSSYNASKEHRLATRGLLLCIAVFFSKPHASDDAFFPIYLPEARRRFKSKSKVDVDAEFAYFMTLDTASIDAIIMASENVKGKENIDFAPFRTRAQTNVGSSPICYDGVVNWLYAAGFISRQWLAATHVHASTIHNHLGDGHIVKPDQWHTIERGFIWNVSKKTDRETCHWGLSLGNGRAVGCNNTSQNKIEYENDGDDRYGKFNFVALCDVLERTDKYRGLNLRVGEGIEGKVAAASKGDDKPRGSLIEIRKFDPRKGNNKIYY